jgi:hypothetical protein
MLTYADAGTPESTAAVTRTGFAGSWHNDVVSVVLPSAMPGFADAMTGFADATPVVLPLSMTRQQSLSSH